MSRRDRTRLDEPAVKSAARITGFISVCEVYCIDEAKLRLRWTDAAYRAALRRGLQVLESGKRRYVTGEEILRFLKADSSLRRAP